MESLKMQEPKFPKSTWKGVRKWLSQVKKGKSELFSSPLFKICINVTVLRVGPLYSISWFK